MSVHVPAAVRRRVVARADGGCEYCRVAAASDVASLEMDHTVPLRHGGPTTAENLAWACYHCNLWKGPCIAAVDPAGGRAFLFDPRRDAWDEHFAMRAGEIFGRTPTGRATVAFLKMNAPSRLAVRREPGGTTRRDGF